MITVNPDAFNATSANSLISFIQSEKNMVGTTSPEELFAFSVSLVFAYVAGILAAYYLKRRFSHKLKKDQLDFWIKAERILFVIAAMVITVPPLFDAGLEIIFLVLLMSVAVFALAGQKVIVNLISGVALRYEHPFTTGDFISAGTTSGTVVSMTLSATVVRDTNGVYVRIPNEQVYVSDVRNYHGNVARRYDFEIGVRYRDDTTEAIRVITGILDGYQFALKHPAPEVFVSDLADSSVKIKIRVWFPSAWANTQDDISLCTRILPMVKRALEAAGIQIPFPQRELWFGNEMVLKKNRGMNGE
jgi:small-conductance mechanosensitive channel